MSQVGRGGGGARGGLGGATRAGDRDIAMGGGRDRPDQVGRGGSAFASRAMQNPMQDTAFGTGIKGDPFAGQAGLNAHRTPNQTSSYEMSWSNLGKLLGRAIPGPGLIAGAGLDIAGVRPGFTGYQGQRYGPGDYDPKNAFDMQGHGPGGIPPGYEEWLKTLLAAPPSPAAPGVPELGPGLMQAPDGFLSVSGPSSYGLMTPRYQYFAPGPGHSTGFI